jgi:hypothetical protein
MPYTPFDPNSFRAKQGIGFQNSVLQKFKSAYPDINFEMVWDFFKNQNPDLTNKELAIIEKKEGDITYTYNGKRHFIECCFALGTEFSRLCEMKRRSFIGENKWYCYGFAGTEDIVFIPSDPWKKFTSHIPKADKSCRIVQIEDIKSMRLSTDSISKYWARVHKPCPGS